MDIAELVYIGVIVRLLNGWVQNTERGEPLKEWWHPYRLNNDKEEMTDEEFYIITQAYDKVRANVMGNRD